jgi:5'-phosphate synthase pdxT subunit
MQDIQLATDIIIGILGESRSTLSPARRLTLKRIIALQGAFAEHQVMLQKISGKGHLEVIQVRTPEELKRCDGLIIPGGGRLSLSIHTSSGLTPSPESSTIALLARLSGLTEPLREFVKTKSVWGTCAGAILLSQAVSNPKKGGQELLGGISVTTTRNGWGSQVRHHAFCVAYGDIDFMHTGRVF